MLGALAAGSPRANASTLLDANRTEPAAVATALDAVGPEAHPRLATLMLDALRPEPTPNVAGAHPLGLFLGSLVMVTIATMTATFVSPIFEEAATQVSQSAPVSHYGLVYVLAFVAMVLGAVGIALRAEGLSPRLLYEASFGGLLASPNGALPRPRQYAPPRGANAVLRWLAVSASAKLPPSKLLDGLRAPPLGASSARRLWHLARTSDDALDAVHRWAKGDRPIEDCAGRIGEEVPARTIRRDAIVAQDIAPRFALGSALSVLGFGALAVAVFLLVAPIFDGIARLGSFV